MAVLLACVVLLLAAVAWFTRTPAAPAGESAPLAGSSTTAAEPRSGAISDTAVHVTVEPVEPAEPAAARTTATEATPVSRALLRLFLQDGSARALTGEFDVEYGHVKSQSNVLGTARAGGPLVRIEVERDGPYEVRVVGTGPGGEPLEGRDTVAAQHGEEAPPTPFALHASRRITGIVVDAQDDPMPGVPLSVLAHFGSERPQRATTSTDAAGHFVLWSPAGRSARLFVGDTELPWIPAIEIDAGAHSVAMDPIRLDLHEATFVVQLADGTPVANAELVGTGLDGGRFEARTDVDGRARVEHMPRGRWRVNAALEPHGRQNRAVEIPLAGGELVVLVLPR